MALYFDLKTIEELIGHNYSRQQKEFTLDELAQFDGPVYVAIEGIVYDVSKVAEWAGGKHFGNTAGQDLTSEFKACHVMTKLDKLPKVGILKE